VTCALLCRVRDFNPQMTQHMHRPFIVIHIWLCWDFFLLLLPFFQCAYKEVKSCNLMSSFADCTGNFNSGSKDFDCITCMFLCYCNLIVFCSGSMKGKASSSLNCH